MAKPKATTTAKPKAQPKAKPPKVTQTTMPIANTHGRPSGKEFNDSQKFQYHKEQANIAFKKGDIVKSSNHMAAMRHAGKRLHEQAKWARENKPR